MSLSAFLTAGSHFLSLFTSQSYLTTPNTWLWKYLTTWVLRAWHTWAAFLFQIVLLKAIPTKAIHHYAATQSYLLKHKTHHLHFLTALLQFYSAKLIKLFSIIWFWSLFPSWVAFCGRTYSFPLLEIKQEGLVWWTIHAVAGETLH